MPLILGTPADDSLLGSAGSDTLAGGLGVDTMVGGDGNDTYVIDRAAELAFVTELPGEGTDTLRIGYANASPTVPLVVELTGNLAEIENVTLVGAGLFNVTGNAAINTLIGNGSINRLDGGAGADSMAGGAGNDTYVVDEAGDQIADTSGVDTVESSLTWSIAASPTLEKVTLTGTEDIDATGNALANVLTGNSGLNTLTGLAGNDTYVVQNTGDVVVEAPAGGIDVVRASADFTLGDNVENLVLVPGAGDLHGTGNALANTIAGNTGNNVLDGAGGRDLLAGGAGNDTYVVDLIRPSTVVLLEDTITEALNAGTDSLELRVGLGFALASPYTFLLTANVENLDFSGTGTLAINATGNALANVITGNDGNNTLAGGLGTDTLTGGIGNDTYVLDKAAELAFVTELADGGTDTLRIAYANPSPTVPLSIELAGNLAEFENLTLVGAGLFNVTGNAAANTLIGNGSINRLDGGAGADSMAGGAGNDTYVVDEAGDQIADTSGVDTVESSLTWSIAASPTLEKVTLTGTEDIDATGNALANVLTGNSGLNTLTGLAGNDTYVVQNTDDAAVEAPAGGIDVVRASADFTLGDNVENLVLVPGAGDSSGTGNALVNTITGNTGNNVLDGAGGRDILVGGAGNDTYVVDLIRSGAATVVQDVVTELANGGNDTLALRAGDGYTLGAPYTATLVANVENLDLSLTGTLAINATGNAGANAITGNAGNNLLSGLGGSDSLDGGGGNDILVWDPADGQINGGAGVDTLRIDGTGAALDLTGNATITNIEVINLTGTGNNTLTLGVDDVLAITSGGVLRIDGNQGDIVSAGVGWVQGDDQVIGANNYHSYTQDSATLLVDSDVYRAGPPAIPVGDSIALTGNPYIDGLVQGGSWEFPESRVITYSLNIDDEGTPRAWTLALTNAIDRAFTAWSNVIDVDFQRINSGKYYFETVADISVVLISDATLDFAGLGIFPDPEAADLMIVSGGETRLSYPHPEGDIVFNLASKDYIEGAPGTPIRTVNIFSELDPGEVGYYVMLHEIGHALGLKHAFDDGLNGRPTFTELGIGLHDFQRDTVMSGAIVFNGVYPGAPVVLDILAAQHIYGANTSYHAGDDLYRLVMPGSALPGIALGRQFTIWDTGGTDTLTFDPVTYPFGVVVDLREGQFSGIYGGGLGNGIGIAYGVVIENAIGGIYSDTLLGNDAANSLSGGAGDDTFQGGAGGDSVAGGAGNDSMTGDDGADFMSGDGGNDSMHGGNGADSIGGGAGNDDLSGDNYLSFTGDGINGDDMIDGGTGDDVLNGNSGNDTLSGGDGNDSVFGGDFDDLIVGNGGNDYLYGMDGDDSMDGGGGNDTIVAASGFGSDDTATGGAGADEFALNWQFSGPGGTITDFTQGEDLIGLGSFSNSLFSPIVHPVYGVIPAGPLISGVLVNSATASNTSQHLLYDGTTGNLYYDSDGSGTSAPVQIATMTTDLTLVDSDFVAFFY